MVLLAASLAVVLFPLVSPLMTASNPKPRFSMASNRNFPKALIATGLAAALVGCGGGSSDDTAMEGSSQAQSQEEMDMEAQRRAISAAKAAFAGAQSTLQTALDSATTDQERIAAHEAMKSASDAFRDALYKNDGSAADLLIATNAYDRSASEISKLEMMIADKKEMDDQTRRDMVITSAKRTYNRAKEALDLVLNGPSPTPDQIFNASTRFKIAANTYLSTLIANEGPQDDKVQAEKVLVQQDIDENNDLRIFPHINDLHSDLQAQVRGLHPKAPTTAQINSVNDAINDLSAAISAAGLTGASGSPYTAAISSAQTSVNSARMTIADNISEAGSYFDAIGSNPLGNTASYSDKPETPVKMDKEIDVTIGSTTTKLTPSSDTLPPIVVSVTPPREWNGEVFKGGNIESHVYSRRKSYDDYYPAADRSTAGRAEPSELHYETVEATYNQSLIQIDEFSAGTQLLKWTADTDENDDGTPDVAKVSGHFNGVKGTFICDSPSGGHICAAQKLTSGKIVLGETAADQRLDADGGASAANAQWTFLPDDVDSLVASYASFGYWTQTVDNKPTRIGSFHGFTGREKDELASTANLSRIVTGSANYTGGAAGRYAFYDTTEEGSYHGQFTAEVTLNADFVNDQISGMIDSFTATDSTGMIRSNTWQVDLEPIGFDDMGQISSTVSTSRDVTWTIDEEEYRHQGSRWSGNFREFVEDTAGTTAAADAPNIVTGQFSANASDSSGNDFARLIGAFGAEKD